MLLQLRRSAAQEEAFDKLIDELHDRKSPTNFHHWLSPSQVGAQFGPATSDIQTVTAWLQQHGFTVNRVYPNGLVIDYSGAAGQVREAFHTEIHNLSVDGAAHFANTADPQIPAALAPWWPVQCRWTTSGQEGSYLMAAVQEAGKPPAIATR